MTSQYADVIEIPVFEAFDGTLATVAARLVNFETGEYYLKGGHTAWLQEEAMRAILASPNAWIDIYGYASKLGNRQANLELSENRAKSVKEFLGQELIYHGRRIDGMVNIDRGFGEDAPNYDEEDSDNSEYWRAAEVVVFGSKPNVTRPPRTPPVSITEATEFEIRLLGGFSIAVSDEYWFQIVDLARRKTAIYQYAGGTMGISANIDPGSASNAGPPSSFRTSRSVQLYQFNTRASLYKDPGIGIGPLGAGGNLHLTLKEIHDENGLIFTDPSIIEIEPRGGITLPGISAGEGVLALVSEIYDFDGY